MTDHPSTREAPCGCSCHMNYPGCPDCNFCRADHQPSALPGVREPAEPRVRYLSATDVMANGTSEIQVSRAAREAIVDMQREALRLGDRSELVVILPLVAFTILSTAHATAERLLEENAKLVESQTNWLRTTERYQQALEAIRQRAQEELSDIRGFPPYRAGFQAIRDEASKVLLASLPAPLPAPEAT